MSLTKEKVKGLEISSALRKSQIVSRSSFLLAVADFKAEQAAPMGEAGEKLTAESSLGSQRSKQLGS